jgi:hypothetical protein
MPKNNVTDLITDQEITFARLVLSGTMTDRHAAEAAGLDPDSAAYTKSKPRVRAYMLEHRAAVEQQLVEQDTEELRRFDLSRGQILARLWEIANLDPERTRGSASAQVKALSMIVAIEGLIPDRRAVPAQNNSAPPPVHAGIYTAAWLREQQGEKNVNPQPPPVPDQQEAELQSAPGGADDPPPPVSGPTPNSTPNLSESTFAGPLDHSQATPAQTTSLLPRVPMADFVPDTRVPFSIDRNRFGRRRR